MAFLSGRWRCANPHASFGVCEGHSCPPEDAGGALRATGVAQAQCVWPQPEPQPGSSPSATWKLEPQPQAETTFGLSILNPDSFSVSRKSMVDPCRYGALKGSTTTRTPWNSSS